MSSPLAIAAVTAILKDLLNEGLINNDLSPLGSFTVSALPPDRITTGETETSRLNLFLYQVTPNIGWRNRNCPRATRRARGSQIRRSRSICTTCSPLTAPSISTPKSCSALRWTC